MTDDGFDTQRALTREFREALDLFADDARRLVREEVARGSPDLDEWADLARRAAADEVRASAGQSGVSWPSALAGAGLALGALLVVLGVGRMVGSPAPSDGGPTGEVAAAVAVPDSATADSAASHPAWVRLDSLFATRDSALLGLVQDASSLDSTSAGRVQAWWAGTGPPSDETIDALVRVALRQLGDSSSIAGPVPPELMARLVVLRAVESP